MTNLIRGFCANPILCSCTNNSSASRIQSSPPRELYIPCSVLSRIVGTALVLFPASYLFHEDTLSLFLNFPDMWEHPLSVLILIYNCIFTTPNICLPYYSTVLPVDYCIQFHPIFGFLKIFENVDKPNN